ncbi:hypothetical protein [Bacillus cereus]|nr:hypothetical protein [Bacillus cereus]
MSFNAILDGMIMHVLMFALVICGIFMPFVFVSMCNELKSIFGMGKKDV